MRFLLLILSLLLTYCGGEVTVRHVFIKMGQSNNWHNVVGSRGSSGTDSRVPYFYAVGAAASTDPPAFDSGGVYVDLQGLQGDNLKFGSRLADMGLRPIILNVTYGATKIVEWVNGAPGSDEWTNFVSPQLDAGLARLKVQFPTDTFVFHFQWCLGEDDARYNDLPTQQHYASWFADVKAQVAAKISASFSAQQAANLDSVLFQTYRGISGIFFPYTIADQQLVAAGSSARLVTEEDGSLYVDTVHRTDSGYDKAGTDAANAWIGLITMGTLSATARSALVDHQNNKSAYSPAATHYVHWYSGGVALTSGNAPGYVKNTVTNNTTTWPNAASRIKSNGIAFTQTPSGTGLSPDEVRITDNATEGSGTVLASDTFTPVVWTVAGGPVSIVIGAFTITAATNVAVGGFTDAVVHSLYNLMFGGTAYTQLATTYLSYWAGDPAGAGSIAGGSVAMTQASQWGAASSGQAQSILSVILTQQATGTYFAIHDTAAGAGVLLMTCARAASIGASGTILAGQLLTTMP